MHNEHDYEGINVDVEHEDLEHNLRTPCRECPFVGKIPGWLGGEERLKDFV